MGAMNILINQVSVSNFRQHMNEVSVSNASSSRGADHLWEAAADGNRVSSGIKP